MGAYQTLNSSLRGQLANHLRGGVSEGARRWASWSSCINVLCASVFPYIYV